MRSLKCRGKHISDKYQNVKLDSGLMFNKVRYTSYSISGGYAYNWVFAHNWLFAASLSVALATKDLLATYTINRNSHLETLNLEM